MFFNFFFFLIIFLKKWFVINASSLSLSHLNGEEGIEEKLLGRKLMDKKLTMRRKK